MFYKLLNFLLVYILSIFNFVIILSPMLLFLIPIIIANTSYIKSDSAITIILMMFFIVSCIMILVVILDFLFGFSSKIFLKKTKEYSKLKDYEVLQDIFEDIKLQFHKPYVKLLISESEETNAFAIGNMRKQYIVITKGLITTYLMKQKGKEYFLSSMKCIIGHEMSHLLNKDYLPTLLLQINENATQFVSKIILRIFQIVINIFSCIPILGRVIAGVILNIYKVLNFFIEFFYKYIILTLYKFIQLKVSRNREYRCDLQSAKANGGHFMADTLSVLGESGYMTIFSTHPKTSSRMKAVENIEKIFTIIKPQYGNVLVNIIFIIFIFCLPLIIYNYMDLNGLVDNYNGIISSLKISLLSLRLKIGNLLNINF